MNTQSPSASLMKEKNLSKAIIKSRNGAIVGSQFDYFVGKGEETKVFLQDTLLAQTVTENTALLASRDFIGAEIKFSQKRFGDAFEISKQEVLSGDEKLIDDLKQLLVNRIYRAISFQAFGTGTRDGEGALIQSILDFNLQTTGSLNGMGPIEEFTAGATLANIQKAYSSYVSYNTTDAIWVVDAADTVINLVDASGSMLLKTENRANGSIGTIFGFPVYIQSTNNKAKMVLMNPKAYAVSIARDVEFREGYNQHKAMYTVVADLPVQGKVVDQNAIKIIKV